MTPGEKYMKSCNYYGNQCRLFLGFRIFDLMIIAVLVLFCCGQMCTGANKSNSIGKQAASPMTEQCRADLAKRLMVKPGVIKIVSTTANIWSDASLGMPQIGKMYAQMMTPGSVVILGCKNTQYLYTVSTKVFRYGGPLNIWGYSFLYTKPVKNEPNLNGDLYQCSLLGTNSVRVVSGVTDYYPQDKGMVIIKRRSSRSSHELLYIKADGSGKAVSLASAFDFGEAAFSDKQDSWAGFVRPSLGDEWSITVRGLGRNISDTLTLPLPEGVLPGHIAWSGEKIVIQTTKEEKASCFEILPASEKSVWNEVGVQAFPGMADYMLNKSESLEINQTVKNDKWNVEVARVWFTGDRNIIAQIDDFTLRGSKLLGRRFAYIWGEKDSTTAVFTVDIATGEIITFPGGTGEVKPFLSPVGYSPLVLLKTK
jgi:hypothetical protein